MQRQAVHVKASCPSLAVDLLLLAVMAALAQALEIILIPEPRIVVALGVALDVVDHRGRD